MIRWLLPLQSLALALVLSWPAAAHLGTAAVGSPEGDGVKHLWTLWWMRQEALHGETGLFTTLVNFPTGMPLYPIEPSNGLLSLLIPASTVALSNILAILHLTLLGISAGWLGRLVSERRGGAYVAGALAQGSSFAAFTLHVGVGELRQVWWIPLGLACLVQARRSVEPRWFAALAACLVGATLSCFYHGFFLATAVALYALATLRPWPRLLASYAAAAALSVAVVYPVIHTFSQSYAPADSRPSTSFSTWMTERYDLDTYQAAAMDPHDLVRSRAHLQSDRQTLAYTGGRYLGVLTLLLAAMGVAAEPRKALPWLVVGAGGLVLSLGTVLWWDGALVTLGGGRVVLPLAPLNRALAFVAEPMNFPARFISVTTIALAVLGSLATRWRVAFLLAPLALIDMARGDLVPWPRATITLPNMTGLAVDTPGAVADLTVFTRASIPSGNEIGQSLLSRVDPESRTRAISAQILLNRPFSTVPVERVDHWGPEGLYWTAALPLSRALAGSPQSEEDLRASAWLLSDAGFGAVLLTHGCQNGAPAAAAELLDKALGARVRAPCGTVWPVHPVDDGGNGERWKAEQATRAAAAPPPRMGPRIAPPG